MQNQVLYYCPCEQSHTSTKTSQDNSASQVTSSDTLQARVSHPPNLPAYSPASRYAFHQLESLYFCDECDQIRCNRCIQSDVASYFCPNCLFEVPGASVKAEKNRCARNCFICPCCTHILSVLASDLEDSESDHLLSPASSQGQSPYYLGCSFCKWDSKSIGLVFEKPTGISLQLQRQEDNAFDALEFERLKDHFDPFIKIQTQAATAANAVGAPKPLSRSSAGLGTSSSTAGTGNSNSKSDRPNATRAAASAALMKSKLLRDLPLLSSSKYLSSQAGLHDPLRAGKIEPDEISPYKALTSWNSDRSSPSKTDNFGSMGKGEKNRRDFLANIKTIEGNPDASVDEKVASLAQRLTAGSDQSLQSKNLRPTRVPLLAKLSKRCPACRHIIIKPDIKAASDRFKIKLVAVNYLPEIRVALVPRQPVSLMPSPVPSAKENLDDRVDGSSVRSALPPKPLLSTDPSSMSVPGTNFLSADSTSNDVYKNRLLPGQTYIFQISVTNPLDDPLRVSTSFVRVSPPSAPCKSTAQVLRDSRYIFAASQSTDVSSDKPAVSQTTEGDAERKKSDTRPARKSRFGWRVNPSTADFPLNAFSEVWELEKSGGLFDDQSKSEADWDLSEEQEVSPPESDFSDVDNDDSHNSLDANSSEPSSRIKVPDRTALDSTADTSRRAPIGRKPFSQRGHTTTISLGLTISDKDAPPPGHPIEVAMHVTYSYSANDATAPAQTSSQHTQRDFHFWTALRLGTIAGTPS